MWSRLRRLCVRFIDNKACSTYTNFVLIFLIEGKVLEGLLTPPPHRVKIVLKHVPHLAMNMDSLCSMFVTQLHLQNKYGLQSLKLTLPCFFCCNFCLNFPDKNVMNSHGAPPMTRSDDIEKAHERALEAEPFDDDKEKAPMKRSDEPLEATAYLGFQNPI